MTKVTDILDLDNLARRIAGGYITERRANGRRLWNYTAKAQYERVWVIWKGLYPVAERPFRVGAEGDGS